MYKTHFGHISLPQVIVSVNYDTSAWKIFSRRNVQFFHQSPLFEAFLLRYITLCYDYCCIMSKIWRIILINGLLWKFRLLEGESCSHSCLGYESQNENWYGFKNEDKETADEKKNKTNNMTKCGGILSILPLLEVFGSLVGAAGISKAINDNKAAQRQLEELKRHNFIMEFISLRISVDKQSQQKK